MTSKTLAKFVDRLSRMSRVRKRALVMAVDAVLCMLAVWFSYFLRLGDWRFFTEDVAKLTGCALAVWYACAYFNTVYREVFRYAGAGTLINIARAIATMILVMVVIFVIYFVPGVPRTLAVLQPIVFFLFLAIARMLLRYTVLDLGNVDSFEAKRRRILIYGAGNAGQRLAASIRHERGLELIGYVDDDARKHGHRLDRLPIHNPKHLPELIRHNRISDVYIAIPRLSMAARGQIIDGLSEQPVHVMTLPEMREIINGDVSVSELREVEISDLLGRPPVDPDPDLLARTVASKVVMVTGAGGSIGSELCMQIARLRPRKLVLVEMNEYALYSIDRAIAGLASKQSDPFEIVPELCNVSDETSIGRVMERCQPDTVFHTAAYKHVPLVERNVLAGARNNILGTLNTARAACTAGVDNFILISTDKAVRPTNIMGATKRICEQILQAFASNPQANRGTIFAMVRFGNVLGSSGSVVPLFKRQIRQGGPITLTDRRMTRYFMTIPEAAELVIQAGAMASGGEVYVLDMGQPVKIIDLARAMIRLSGLRERHEEATDGDVEIVELGLRPGEKLYEELLIGDNPEATAHERVMQARESYPGYAELVASLDRMEELLNAGAVNEVRALIAELVPEYAPPEY